MACFCMRCKPEVESQGWSRCGKQAEALRYALQALLCVHLPDHHELCEWFHCLHAVHPPHHAQVHNENSLLRLPHSN